MSRYRKKPVEVEAVQWDGTFEDAASVIAFCHGSAYKTLPPTGHYLFIKTLEGDMRVSPKDFIIRGVQGEHYPCKPDIFAATYELVQD